MLDDLITIQQSFRIQDLVDILIIALMTILYIWLGKVRFDGGDR